MPRNLGFGVPSHKTNMEPEKDPSLRKSAVHLKPFKGLMQASMLACGRSMPQPWGEGGQSPKLYILKHELQALSPKSYTLQYASDCIPSKAMPIYIYTYIHTQLSHYLCSPYNDIITPGLNPNPRP